MSGKNVFIVYAHQEPSRSFNGALKDAAVEELQKAGYEVKVSDLYAMKFKATATEDDIIGGAEGGKPFNYLRESARAAKENLLAPDIVAELEKLKWADILILQFPVNWFGLPAILRGWINRVFVSGEVYRFPDKLYNLGLFKGKTALLSLTTGGAESMYRPDGINGDIHTMLWPLHNALNFLGYSVLEPNICFDVLRIDQEAREAMLETWRKRVVGLQNETPQRFFKLEDFEYHGFGPMKKEVLEEAKKNGFRPIGQLAALTSD